MDKTLSGTICLMIDCDATCNNGTYKLCDGIAKVVRPQIEAEARAAAIELAARECEKPCDSLPELAARIRALATVPPSYVVIPVEPTHEMLEAAQYVDECADPMNTFKAIWEAMLAARPK